MGGMARMSGIAHGVSAEPVFYDKDGIVHANEHNAVKPDLITGTTEKPVQYVPAYSSKYYIDKPASPEGTKL
jgi:hypothetical protein